MNKISIIIPILNEAKTIDLLLHYLIKNCSKKNIADIIIVDGGSTDNSVDVISKHKNITLIKSKKGRAKQMNKGAKVAQGNILYFLHADSFPPKNFDFLIINQISKNNLAGCFKMKFDSNNWWLKLAGWLTKFSWRISRGGDQSLFVTKQLFNTIGGYDETFTIYEDNDFIAKLYNRKQFVVIQEWLTTSARCYNTNGVFKLQLHFWAIHLKKFFGASPNELNRYYVEHVSTKK